MKTTILLIIVLIVLLWNSREGFTKDANINTFLNTWHTTNDELKKIGTPTDNSMDMGKNITFPREKGIKFGYTGNKNLNDNNWEGSIRATNDDGIHFAGIPDKDWNNKRTIKIWDQLSVEGELHANKIHSRFDLSVHGGSKMRVGSGSGGNENNWIAKNQLCIGGVCINADHLRILKGEKNVHLKNNGKNALIDCGGKSGDRSSTRGMRDGKTCYINDNNKNNTNQQFRLVM
jgi:hypothetical protein